jgi:DNA-binding response OmpR family regulator
VVVGYLRRAGMTVEQAADGPTALAMARARLPDLAVLDLMLPGLDGLEVCRRLRELGPVAVIMLTALGTESDRVQLARAERLCHVIVPQRDPRRLPWRGRPRCPPG